MEGMLNYREVLCIYCTDDYSSFNLPLFKGEQVFLLPLNFICNPCPWILA